ncbi:hypothetical protein [Pontibacter sp. G13]|uniref:hypothetical protein n=1 Tax=Pontibacter sp. G13 TaxID=3074898 RepID=UPI00288AD673|nr:hypothetical protein [Pontibacter sp. G13]WNJ17022.1 hypothetical protein RJD25_19380 [Pontibacter sp. G13]
MNGTSTMAYFRLAVRLILPLPSAAGLLLVIFGAILGCSPTTASAEFDSLPIVILSTEFGTKSPYLPEDQWIVPEDAGTMFHGGGGIYYEIMEHISKMAGIQTYFKDYPYFDSAAIDLIYNLSEEIGSSFGNPTPGTSIQFHLLNDSIADAGEFQLTYIRASISPPTFYDHISIPRHAISQFSLGSVGYPEDHVFPQAYNQDTLHFFTYDTQDVAFHFELLYISNNRTEHQHLIIPSHTRGIVTTLYDWESAFQTEGK